MKTRVCIVAALIGLAGYMPGTSWSADATNEMTDAQAIQALRDLRLPPETILDMVRNELRASIQNKAASGPAAEDQGAAAASGSTPQVIVVGSSATATGAAPELTDEQAAQTLRDLGLPPRTVLAIIRKKLLESTAIDAPSSPAPQGTTGNIGTTAQPAAGASSPPQAPVYGGSAPVAPVTTPEVRTVEDFRTALAPHGSWITLEPYGVVWQPMVTVINTSWRPYVDDGTWEWTDDGWCWRSKYSWGWAAFHYGRWAYVTDHRWVWIPDTVWAPSWVQWRYSDSYVGWAPLPPEACYDRSGGFRYRGARVSIDCSFGLTDWHYSFVPASGFAGMDPCRIAIPRHEARRVYSDTISVRNTYTTRDNVVLPTLPREIAVNAGRRTDNLVRIMNQHAAGPAQATSVQTTRQSVPSTARSYARYWPEQDAQTADQVLMSADRRTETLLDMLRRNQKSDVQHGVDAPVTVRRTGQPNVQSRSTPETSKPQTAAASVSTGPATQNPDRNMSRGDRLRSILRDKENKD